MEKKVVVIVHPGLPYRKTVLYGNERAREIGAKVLLLGIIPEFDGSSRVAFAMHEFTPYNVFSKKVEDEFAEFLDRVVQFCLDNGITAETRIEQGGMEDVIRKLAKSLSTRLVIVPTPTKKVHHADFLDSIRQFAHNMLDHELRCPVVSVLAT